MTNEWKTIGELWEKGATQIASYLSALLFGWIIHLCM
jgi:hypothetical protein